MPAPRPTKRELTRSALLEAVQRTLLEEPPGTLSVPRLVALAGVSQGTFYNYFDSLDAALDGVGLLLVAEHGRLVAEVTAGVDDPAEVFARSTRLTLTLAVQAEGYGRLLFDSGLPVDRLLIGLQVPLGRDIAAGLAAGRFRVQDPDVVISMVSGSVLGVAIELHRRRLPLTAVGLTVERLLRDLGVGPRTSARLARLPLRVPTPRPLPLSITTPDPTTGEGDDA